MLQLNVCRATVDSKRVRIELLVPPVPLVSSLLLMELANLAPTAVTLPNWERVNATCAPSVIKHDPITPVVKLANLASSLQTGRNANNVPSLRLLPTRVPASVFRAQLGTATLTQALRFVLPAATVPLVSLVVLVRPADDARPDTSQILEVLASRAQPPKEISFPRILAAPAPREPALLKEVYALAARRIISLGLEDSVSRVHQGITQVKINLNVWNAHKELSLSMENDAWPVTLVTSPRELVPNSAFLAVLDLALTTPELFAPTAALGRALSKEEFVQLACRAPLRDPVVSVNLAPRAWAELIAQLVNVLDARLDGAPNTEVYVLDVRSDRTLRWEVCADCVHRATLPLWVGCVNRVLMVSPPFLEVLATSVEQDNSPRVEEAVRIARLAPPANLDKVNVLRATWAKLAALEESVPITARTAKHGVLCLDCVPLALPTPSRCPVQLVAPDVGLASTLGKKVQLACRILISVLVSCSMLRVNPPLTKISNEL